MDHLRKFSSSVSTHNIIHLTDTSLFFWDKKWKWKEAKKDDKNEKESTLRNYYENVKDKLKENFTFHYFDCPIIRKVKTQKNAFKEIKSFLQEKETLQKKPPLITYEEDSFENLPFLAAI